jgi:hypothetical protein
MSVDPVFLSRPVIVCSWRTESTWILIPSRAVFGLQFAAVRHAYEAGAGTAGKEGARRAEAISRESGFAAAGALCARAACGGPVIAFSGSLPGGGAVPK